MNKRQIIIILAGVGILAISIALSGMLTKERKQKPEKIALQTAVRSKRLSPQKVNREIPITGRLIPKQSVTLYAEVTGMAQFGSKAFKEGVFFKKGEVILAINSDELNSSLKARRSAFQSLLASVIPDLKLDFSDNATAWENYLYSIDIEKKLPPLPEIGDKKLKLFLSGRNIYAEFYSISELETRFDKHRIKAPFSGSLTGTELDEASLVRAGQPLGTFISAGHYELEAGVSYTDAEILQLGREFEMKDANTGNAYLAKVVRINDQVDPETQQVKIYANIDDPKARSGIYLEGMISSGEIENAIEIPISALVGENQIFTVEDSTARLKEVYVAFKNSEKAILTGIDGPLEVVIDKQNESLDGSKVAPVNTDE